MHLNAAIARRALRLRPLDKTLFIGALFIVALAAAPQRGRAASDAPVSQRIVITGTVPLTPYFVEQMTLNSTVRQGADSVEVIVRGPAMTLLRNHRLELRSGDRVVSSALTDAEGKGALEATPSDLLSVLRVWDVTYPSPIALGEKAVPSPAKDEPKPLTLPHSYFFLGAWSGIIRLRKRRNARPTSPSSLPGNADSRTGTCRHALWLGQAGPGDHRHKPPD